MSRNAPEKLFVTQFKDVMPPTLISSDPAAIRAFRVTHKDIVLKPLYGNGGAGVFRLKEDDENLATRCSKCSPNSTASPSWRSVMSPRSGGATNASSWSKAKSIGAINRVPAQGEARSYLHVGGRAEAVELSPRDRAICAAIGPELKARGLIFAGHRRDRRITSPQINVTIAHFGIQEVKRFGGADGAACDLGHPPSRSASVRVSA